MNSILINGKNYDWGNLSWIIFGIKLVGITEINYTKRRDAPNNYGSGYEPISYGYTNFEYMGDISVYIDELVPIRKASPDFDILKIPPFSATNMFSGDGVVFRTEQLKNIRFTEDPFTSKQNDTNIIVKIPFVFAGLFKS